MGRKPANCSALAAQYRTFNKRTLKTGAPPIRPKRDEIGACRGKAQGLTVRSLRGPGRAAGANFVLWPRTHARVRFGAQKYKKSRAGAAYGAVLLSAGVGKRRVKKEKMSGGAHAYMSAQYAATRAKKKKGVVVVDADGDVSMSAASLAGMLRKERDYAIGPPKPPKRRKYTPPF